MTTRKTLALTRGTFVDKVMSLLFNMQSRLVITFLPESKHILISCLQSPSAVIFEPLKIKSATISPSISNEVMEPDAMIIIFWMLSFTPTFSLSSFTLIKRLFSSSSLSATRVVLSACLRLLILSQQSWGEGENRGWDSWMASLTQWTWVWVNSGSWWGTRGLKKVRHDWATELNWYFSQQSWSQLVLHLAWRFAWCTLHRS